MMIERLKQIFLGDKYDYYKMVLTIIVVCIAIILSYDAGNIVGKIISQLKDVIF